MKEKFLNYSIKLIEINQKISEMDREKIKYGLEALYLSITKMSVILLLAFLLGIIKEVLLLIIFFNILRFTGFGFHARKSSECFIITIISFIIIPLILLNISLGKEVMLLVGILGTIYILLYAPADTIKRPLPNKKKRRIRKIVTTITSITYLVIALLINNYSISILLLCAIIIESIMVSPITYKIFKQPYRNYLNYKMA